MNQVLRYFTLVIFLVLIVNTLEAQINNKRPFLKLNQMIDETIKTKEQDDFLLSMKKDQTAIVRIERGSFKMNEEMNLLMTIISPEGEIVEELNTANDASFVIFDAVLSGDYKVIIRRWNGAESGSYKIVLDYLKNTSISETEQIDNLLAHFYNDKNPGASILIQKNGRPYYKRSFGLSNLNHNTEITDSTIFDIASVSKQIAAYSIAMLASENKLELSNSIRNFIPEFPEYGDEIAILHLVLNVSGIKDYDQIIAMSGYDEDNNDNITSERILNAIMSFQDTYFQPGTEYRYSNSGYFLIAELVSRVTGMPYAQWVEENIFKPLNMHDSYIYEGQRKLRRNASSSYKKEGYYDGINVPISTYQEQAKNLKIFSVHTSISDYAKWIKNYKTGVVGGAKTLKIIETGIHDDPNAWNWAFGFQKTKYKEINQKLSQGIIQGYRSSTSYFPDMDMSLLYFSNDGEWRTFYLAEQITDIILNKSNSENEIVSSYSFEGDTVSNNSSGNSIHVNLDLDSTVEGVYLNSALSKNFSIVKSNEQLILKLFGLKEIVLEQINQQAYKTNKWYMSKIVFERDENERIIACKIYNSRTNDFILFDKVKD